MGSIFKVGGGRWGTDLTVDGRKRRITGVSPEAVAEKVAAVEAGTAPTGKRLLTPGIRKGQKSGPKSKDVAERIWDRIVVTDEGCWEWQGGRNQHGYGQIYVGSRRDGTRRNAHAHRVSYETFKGEIPKGLHLDHLCRNPPCVNPDHLEPVTVHENVVVRGVGGPAAQSRRTHCPQGHEYTPENTKRHNNKRYCIACQVERNARAKAARAAAREGRTA